MPAPCAAVLHSGVKYITARLSPGLTVTRARGHSCQEVGEGGHEWNKIKEAGTTDTAWKWTSFATQGNRFLEGSGWEAWGMWLSLTWWLFFPCWCHLGNKVALKLTGRNPWLAQSKELLQCVIEVALACRWSFWQIGDLTGSKRLVVFAKEWNPASFWGYTHKTQRGFVKINRQPLLWRLWMWTSNSSVKPFQSRVNVIFTPILF